MPCHPTLPLQPPTARSVTALPRALLQPSLRPVEETDHDRLLDLYRATHRVSHEALSHLPQDAVRALLAMQLHAQAATFRRRHPGAEFYVVCDQYGHVMGRLTVARDGADWHLLDMALLPEYRGYGWGTALIEWLQSKASATEGSLQLIVSRSAAARQLYRRTGFVVTGQRESEVLMRWTPRSGQGA